ncbi:MAG: hypothetical protein AAB851_00980 [Patescibacteria group bacterium]
MIQLIFTIFFFIILAVCGILSWVIIYHLKTFSLPQNDHSKFLFYFFASVFFVLTALAIFFFFRIPFNEIVLPF